MTDLEWMKRFCQVTGWEIGEEDLQGILRQLRPLKEGLERIRSVPLEDCEIPLTFRPLTGKEPEARE